MDSESAAREGAAVGLARRSRALDITVLMGGPSAERDVSIASGTAIADALARVGHKVIRADISPTDVSALDRPGIDVVFIALHGEFGESGEVQGLCEARSLRYTGSGPRSSQLAMDKAATKQICRRQGLATPEWVVVEQFQVPAQVARQLNLLPLPVVLKPVDGGSSVDIVIARDAAERDGALDMLLDKYSRALVERYVEGREITVSILGDEALPVLEIIPSREFYDLRAKYADDAGTRYVFDHGLSDEMVQAVQAAALTAHAALGCRDMSRVDFILDEHAVAHLLELNTIPGFTSHSLLPKAAARVGISFDELVDRIASMAMQR